MDIHDNARTTRHSRMLTVQRLASGRTVAAVAAAQGVSPKTVCKWRDRHAAEGETGLADRSSRLHRSPRRLAAPIETEIVALRHERLSSPAIARRLGRLSALTPRPPVIAPARATSVASAGRLCTSPAMMPPAWPTPNCCPTNARRARWPSLTGDRLVRPPRRDGRAHHDRQRFGLSQPHLSRSAGFAGVAGGQASRGDRRAGGWDKLLGNHS
jgi:hypothetical protein